MLYEFVNASNFAKLYVDTFYVSRKSLHFIFRMEKGLSLFPALCFEYQLLIPSNKNVAIIVFVQTVF